VLQYDPKSVFAEAYRALQANVKIARFKEGEKKVLLITSATSNEGKTITAANYAVAAAQSGLKVLLVDLDLRKPVLHRIFGVQREPGITDVLVGNVKLDESLRGISDFLIGGLDVDNLLRTQGVENLKLLSAGFISPNPTTILSSAEFTKLLGQLKEKFDIVVLDCPPVIPVADAIIVGGKADAVMLIYQVGRVARGALKRAETQLMNANASILGVVLNEIRAGEMEMGHAYYYYYYKSYREESKNWWEKFKNRITGRKT
jgi:Mrp family chromosome partitioning ATPase